MRANAWDDPRWVEAARDWVERRLGELGRPIAGEFEEMRVRPWSVTYRVATDGGVVWFKANTPGCAYEAGLAAALAGWVPDAVISPLAVDAERGWLLTADAGPTLREVVGPERLLPTWEAMLRDYAVMQRELAGRAGELLSLGVPDCRPSELPARLGALLELPQVREDLGDERLAKVVSLLPEYAAWCSELAGDGIPASLQHDDLTDANVFPAGERFRFFDWGDSSVGHPFGSLLVAMGFAGYLLDLPAGAPEMERLRDSYLEPWSDLAPVAELRRSVSLACRAARISKALAWQRALHDSSLPVADDFRTAVADWVAETSEPPPI